MGVVVGVVVGVVAWADNEAAAAAVAPVEMGRERRGGSDGEGEMG